MKVIRGKLVPVRRKKTPPVVGNPIESFPIDGKRADSVCRSTILLLRVNYTSNLLTRDVQFEGDIVIGGNRRRVGPFNMLPQRATILYGDDLRGAPIISDENIGACPGRVPIEIDIKLDAKGAANPFEGRVVQNRSTRVFNCPETRMITRDIRFEYNDTDQKRLDMAPTDKKIAKVMAFPIGVAPLVIFTFTFKLVNRCSA